MYLFEIISIEPLEPYGEMKYASFASDGASLLFLEQSGPKIARHCPQLQFLEEYNAARCYTGICYDSEEQCYWGCANQCSDTVYKLTTSFREVDRFQLCGYETGFGAVSAIAYDCRDDCLILTFRNRVVAVDKHSLCEKAVIRCGCDQSHRFCIRSGEYYYSVGKRCGGEILTVSRGDQVLIHACLPGGHRCLGIAEVCGRNGPEIRILSVKHGTYYSMLRGVLVHRRALCRQGEAPAPPRCKDQGSCCRDCCEREEGCCHSRGGSIWESRFGGGVSIMESIALEQTALSHILNAEGEKIQKVVAVSDKPSDFLDVNQSVLELLTKVIHLEQVLFSKLDLACGVLREKRCCKGNGELME